MNIVFLCEGNAESWDSWSGVSKSLVDKLRSEGHTVMTGDVDLSGPARWLGAALTFAIDRRHWRTRLMLGGTPFRLRSRCAARHIAAHRRRLDVIVQVGATFQPRGRGAVPYFLCCDSNIWMAKRGAETGHSDAASLTRRELEQVVQRERDVYQHAAGVFTLSERLQRSFIEDWRLPPTRVHAIRAGPNLDVSRIPETPLRPDTDHPPTILFVGRHFYRKGGDLLTHAFQRVRARIPDARLVIAGPSPPPTLEPGVHFLGDLDKNQPAGCAALVAAYRSADVFCLPTRFEPFGIAFIEAMHFGLPCVGTDAGAVPEMITDGETGFTVPIGDEHALTDRLLRLLVDRALARAMGRAGRARAEREFTWERAVQRMTQAILPVVGAGIARAG
ncbi:MAG TPA: glycosyltransferase family 4 protein [Gemmatimonadales bacterium]|jgi:glycosyltransferase involved in cell wall biosynthesis|nr:glycosyltransferase family 4 protein [Gemmatimonadales bacterium]